MIGKLFFLLLGRMVSFYCPSKILCHTSNLWNFVNITGPYSALCTPYLRYLGLFIGTLSLSMLLPKWIHFSLVCLSGFVILNRIQESKNCPQKREKRFFCFEKLRCFPRRSFNSKVYLGSMCTAVLIGWDPATPPPPPSHLGSCTRLLLVSQDRRHFFVTPWLEVSLGAWILHEGLEAGDHNGLPVAPALCRLERRREPQLNSI